MSVAPKGPGGQRGSLAQADVMGATKFSKTPDMAWKLVKGLTSKEAGIILGKQTGNKSATPGGRPDVYESDDLLKLPFPEDTQKNTMFAMQNAEPFTQPANYRGPEVQRAIDPLYEGLVIGKNQPDKAFFDQLHLAVQDVLDKPKP
jgi:ABC-type glycerol-3-phosphate transport system substrate-binding protein